MPHSSSRPLILGAILAAALPASASAKTLATPSCPVPATSTAFAAFGDTAAYSLAPGGDFESSAGWTFTNAGIVAGNETAGVLPGQRSVKLGLDPAAGAATVTSPEFCVNGDFPSFRFLANSPRTAALGVTLNYRKLSDAADKVRTESTTALLPASAGWAPSAITPLATLLTSGNAESGKLVRITFQLSAAQVKAGGASIDDVLIDPYRRS